MGAETPPPDIIAVLVCLFATFSLQFFEVTAIVPALLRLSPLVLKGLLWQLVTYPVVGFGASGLWFLLELLILYWFGRDIFLRLGRKRFWSLVIWTALGAAVVAMLVHLLTVVVGSPQASAFMLMQGQRMVLTILIAAFATLHGEGVILLFFVLPIKARWFLGLEILFAFIGFLNTHDIAGFVGVCVAVALTYSALVPGGPGNALKRWRLQLERLLVERRLARMRRDRNFDVIDGDRDKWVH